MNRPRHPGAAPAASGGDGAAAGRPDEGSAVVEFVVLGMLLLVPVVYLVVTLGRLQAASFAADGGARAATRAFVTAADDLEGAAGASAAVRLALLDQGFAAPDEALQLECSARPCLTPGSTVVARVSVDVVLPGVPEVLDAVVPTHVTIRSTHVAAVDAFRGDSP